MLGMPGGMQLDTSLRTWPLLLRTSFCQAWYRARYSPLNFGCSGAAAPGAGRPRVSTHTPPQSGNLSSAAYCPLGWAAPALAAGSAAIADMATAANAQETVRLNPVFVMVPPHVRPKRRSAYNEQSSHNYHFGGGMKRGLVAALILSVMGAAVQAHHSFAMFDQTQKVTLKGTVTEFQWTN